MLTEAVLKSYLLDMPSGHIFDLTYELFAGMFPPGEATRMPARSLMRSPQSAIAKSSRTKPKAGSS